MKTLAMSPLMGFEGEEFREFIGRYLNEGRPMILGYLVVEGGEVVAVHFDRAEAFAFSYQRGYALVGIQEC